jgi:hypothetical protein
MDIQKARDNSTQIQVGSLNIYLGDKSIYIEKQNGDIYISDSYVTEPEWAFEKGSFELYMYQPTIDPPIDRKEVDIILDWIEQDADPQKSNRVGVLFCKEGAHSLPPNKSYHLLC